MTTIDLRYPVGTIRPPEAPLAAFERRAYLQQIADLPAQLSAAVAQAGAEQMQHPYRPSGWTRHQVVHHVADAHLNGYARFRLALTEDNPTVPPYNPNAWVELADVSLTATDVSLELLAAMHTRWVTLLRHLSEEQWQRTFFRPEMQRTYTLDQALALYAWHGRHHLAHVSSPYPSDLAF
jgi:hypothetical protein